MVWRSRHISSDAGRGGANSAGSIRTGLSQFEECEICIPGFVACSMAGDRFLRAANPAGGVDVPGSGTIPLPAIQAWQRLDVAAAPSVCPVGKLAWIMADRDGAVRDLLCGGIAARKLGPD